MTPKRLLLTYVACAAAEKYDGSVACHLESLHKAKSHKMTDMERIRSRVKAYIKLCAAVVHKLLNFFFVGDCEKLCRCIFVKADEGI